MRWFRRGKKRRHNEVFSTVTLRGERKGGEEEVKQEVMEVLPWQCRACWDVGGARTEVRV